MVASPSHRAAGGVVGRGRCGGITVGRHDGLDPRHVGRCSGYAGHRAHHRVGATVGKGVGDGLGDVVASPSHRAAGGVVRHDGSIAVSYQLVWP